MNRVILIRYGEIYLKGLNRPYFEKKLLENIKKALQDFHTYRILKSDGRIYIKDYDVLIEEDMIRQVTMVFGVHSVSPALEVDKDMDIIKNACIELLNKNKIENGSFKVDSRRSDKHFFLDSVEISKEIGGHILGCLPNATVDVHNPDWRMNVEVRKEYAYVYNQTVLAVGGMPIGTNGKCMLLLSGGIDSPVAGWMTAKRGVELEAVHFYSFPYTSEKAKEKVIDLGRILTTYCNQLVLHIVPFTEIQQRIYDHCPDSLITIIMRRFMMRIAESIAIERNAKVLITGESIGQVASQTLEGLVATSHVVSMPILRPLIGFDKIEIMDKARKIGTYETSILPYEDCCTIFVSKHPTTHPKLERVQAAEVILDIELLVKAAIQGTELILLRLDRKQ